MKKSLFFILSWLFAVNLSVGQVQTVGLQLHKYGSLDSGYVLFAPMGNNTTYLIDKCGKQIQQWKSSVQPGLSAYFLPNGYLLRTGLASGDITFGAGGTGGLIEKIDWTGKVVWSYTISDTTQCAHHDIEPLPNGNILVIAWDKKSNAEEKAYGRKASLLTPNLWSEKIVELKPTGTNSATIVWQWNLWDHLIQQANAKAKNYDAVALHPELVDINYVLDTASITPDWIHANSIKYNADRDEIILSCHNFSEFWVIDHSTTTAQAASHKDGTRNHGGDILYRWGNPAAYKAGTKADQRFYQQHDPYWIPSGYRYSGKIMVFNNGLGRPDGQYSSVEIITPPYDSIGNYVAPKQTKPYLPVSPDYIYTAPNKTDFYSNLISGAQMLSNRNILICSGSPGDVFEIDSTGQKVWDYINPVTTSGPVNQGTPATGFSIFRATYYPSKYSGFKGHTLTPGNPIELNPAPYQCSLFPPDTTIPVVAFSVKDTNVYVNIDTVSISNQTLHAVTYAWSISPASFAYAPGNTSSSKNPKVIFNTPGLYNVVLTATSLKGKKTTLTKASYINATQKGAIPTLFQNYGVQIYPNPTSHGFFLKFNKRNAEGLIKLTVENNLGQMVLKQDLIAGTNPCHIEWQNATPGFYILHLQSGTETYSEKILVK